MSKKTKLDNSPQVTQPPAIKKMLNIKQFKWTEKQKKLIELAMDKKTKLVFISGPAGTSKSSCAIYCALELLNKKTAKQILYVRSPVESGRSLGFRKGSDDEKMAPYAQPLYDKLDEFLSNADIKYLEDDGKIEVTTVGYLRGRSLPARVLILDEASSCTYKEIYTFITRGGEFSKIFVCGDYAQADINNPGFKKIAQKFNDEESKENGIQTFEFDRSDIIRSALVKFIVEKLDDGKE